MDAGRVVFALVVVIFIVRIHNLIFDFLTVETKVTCDFAK